MNITINPEDLTTEQRALFYRWFVNKRVWFSLTEEETYFDRLHQERRRPVRLVATVIGVAIDNGLLSLVTTEGVVPESDFFSIEPYERFPNDDKDRYAPS